MDADMIVKLLLPALFFAAWALNQIVNREPAAGPRVGGGGGGMGGQNPLGPRPVPPGGIEDALRGSGGYGAGEARPAAAMRGGGGRGVPMPGSEEIVILQTETTRGRPPSGARRQPAKRPRGTGPGTGAEQGERRKLVGGVGDTKLQPMKVRPLSEASSDLSGRGSGAAVVGIGVVLPPELGEIRKQLMDPAQVRQALLVNELLGPPVALRNRRGILGGVAGRRTGDAAAARSE